MGSIASTGVGSGLDIAGIVQKLVEAEGTPKATRLNSAEAKVQAKLSALGSLRSALAGFRSALAVLKDVTKFQGRQVALSSPDFLSASAASTAVPGTYSIEVQQLAQAQRQQALPYSAVTDVVGTGTLTITTADETVEIVLDGTNNTLAGVAAAINASAAADDVVATVVSGATQAMLTISARATGEDHEFTVAQTGGDAGLVAFVAGIAPVQPGLDAEALIEGVLVTGSTNTLSGAITGVDVNLLEANDPGDTTQVTVGYNRDAARKAIDDFVKSYNALTESIKAVSSYNAQTRQSGPLFADAGVRNIVFQLRRELMSAAELDGSFARLSDIGVTAELDGKLTVDSTKLDAAFAADFDAIGELFAAEDVGVARKLDALLEPYLQTGGVLDSRTAGLRSTIDDIGDQRQALNLRLEALQARYLKQFNALDTLLAQMQSTSNFLGQQLSRLPDATTLFKD